MKEIYNTPIESIKVGMKVTSIIFSSTFEKVQPIIEKRIAQNVMEGVWDFKRRK